MLYLSFWKIEFWGEGGPWSPFSSPPSGQGSRGQLPLGLCGVGIRGAAAFGAP